ISKDDLAKERFEIVVLLEGTVEATGMTTQARISYLPLEIIWGFRFDRLITFKKDLGQYRVDYTKFNHIYPVEMPSFSAKEMSKEKNTETKVTTKDNKSK
ncbi:unnamed protein product, partial [Didymodactylos carnosus]